MQIGETSPGYDPERDMRGVLTNKSTNHESSITQHARLILSRFNTNYKRIFDVYAAEFLEKFECNRSREGFNRHRGDKMNIAFALS